MFSFLKSDAFFKQSAIYFSGSMIVAVLNYAFHPILGRFLTPVDFGEVQALIALITLSSIFFGSFSVVAINITANTEDSVKRNAILYELQKISLWSIAVLVTLLYFSIENVQSFFNFTSSYVLITFGVMLPLSALATFRNAHIQGVGDFVTLTSSQIVGAGSRLILSVVFVIAGYSLFGVALGIVFAQILLLVFLVKKTLSQFPLYIKASFFILEKGALLKEVRYGILVFFATALITLYYAADVLIIKRFFTPEEAGLYSGISTIAKILFFTIAPVSAVLVAAIKTKNSFLENSASLAKALLIAIPIGGGCLYTFTVFHDMVVRLILGNTYLPFARYLPDVSTLMFLAAIANIFVLYFLALRRFFLVFVACIGFVGTLYALLFNHSTIEAILHNLIISVGFTLIILIIAYGKDYLNYRSCTQ